MKLKTVTSIIVVTLMVCSLLTYNSGISKADPEPVMKTAPFSGYLYSNTGCGTEILKGVPFTAENRTTGVRFSAVTNDEGKWWMAGVYGGELVQVTCTLNGKVGCLLQAQNNSGGYTDLKICMTNSNSCTNEW